MRYINKIGIEIEGGFDDFDYINNIAKKINGSIVKDGSLFDFENSEPLEFISKPYNKKTELKKDIKKIYDNLIEVNKSAGLHIHLSFKKHSFYTYLFSFKFCEYFKKSLFGWMCT